MLPSLFDLLTTTSPRIRHSISQLARRYGEKRFDPFGFEPLFLQHVLPFCDWLYRIYFDTEAFGLENVPEHGPVLLISNHSGQIPIDGMLIGIACLLDKPTPRMIRGMVERWVPEIPFISWFFARTGQVVGTRENARSLLEQGRCLLVFPEGVKGISKTFDRAYRLQPFGLGFMRLAIETQTPIVPVAVIGAEEQCPAIVNLEKFVRHAGIPSFPITPTWPTLGLLGGLPLPTKYRIYFGDPLHFSGDSDDEDHVIKDQVDQVRHAIEKLLSRGLEERRGVFL